MITVAGPRSDMQAVADAFREGGGGDKPMFLQVTLSFAPTANESVSAAYEHWPQCALAPHQLSDLATPAAFDEACAGVSLEDVLARVRASNDIGQHLEWLHEDAAMGFQRIYLHNVARDHQERFIDACGTQLLPAFEPTLSR
jgi:hypothetical protein